MFRLLALLLLFLLCPLRAGEIPTLRLTQGDLPLLIVAGHGGQLPLEGAEIRRESEVKDPHFVLFGDSKTNELATDLADALAQELNNKHRPSLLLNEVHRRYADVNRTPERTSHDPVGVAHHAAYHQTIEHELARLVARHGWALLLDIHGQARYETILLLGTAENTVIDDWSKQAIWGNEGLVESLKSSGFTVMPDAENGKQRYGGGYTVRHHGASDKVEAWQMEHSRAIRDGTDSRSSYLEVVAKSLARAIERRSEHE